MVRIAPDHLGAIRDGQFTIALVVIRAGPGEVGAGKLRAKTNRLGETLNGLLVLVILQVSDTPLHRFDSQRITLFAGHLPSAKPPIPPTVLPLFDPRAVQVGGHL